MKIKLPFVSRKHHEKELEIMGARFRDQQAEFKNQIEILSVELDRILPQLIRVSGLAPDESNFTFRLQIDFSPDFIWAAFAHGNDARMIQFMAERIARQIENEIKTLNFVRYKDIRVYNPRYPFL